MGLFDTLEQAIADGGQPGSGPGPQNVIASVIQMIQTQPGGIAGLVQQFESAGLGGVARSWLGDGANQPVSPGQVQSALGSAPVGQVARSLGVSPDQAASHIAQFLPLVLDHLSPEGQLPPGGGLRELGGLLGRLC
jgi:uncharacterized protein YidB (DUF937 family)